MCAALTVNMDLDVCIISLQKNNTRVNSLQADLKNQGLLARVSQAINGKRLTADSYFHQCVIRSSRWLRRKTATPSELGCWLSHGKALEEFIYREKHWLLMLEDDISISGDLSSFIIMLSHLTTLPQLTDNAVFILGGQDGLASFSRVILRRDRTGLHYAAFGTHRWLYRTCCYLLSRNSAIQILSLMKQSPYVVDDWAYVVKNTQIKKIYYQNYFSHPIDLSYSSIESERILIAGRKK